MPPEIAGADYFNRASGGQDSQESGGGCYRENGRFLATEMGLFTPKTQVWLGNGGG